MFPRTPIRIIRGRVFAFVWNGREYDRGIPVYRLKIPKYGHSLNGRLLSWPTCGQHITTCADVYRVFRDR